jgi:hypothetical protein
VVVLKMRRASAIFLPSPLALLCTIIEGLDHQRRNYVTVPCRPWLSPRNQIGVSYVPRDVDGWSRGTERNLPFIEEQVLLVGCEGCSYSRIIPGGTTTRNEKL